MVRITLARGADRRIRGGHQWIFSNEIGEISGDKVPGEAAEVYDAGGAFLGTGYYNPRSLIAARLLSRSGADVDAPELFSRRLQRAIDRRRLLYPQGDGCRMVHGEGDFLPGLVVDRYGEYLCLQFLTWGMERRRGIIIPLLQELLSPKGIVARNDSSVRELEGLERSVEVVAGDLPEYLETVEHSLRFRVDLLHGQKTGHFLDQKENHLLLKGMSEGRDILDCFCYTGSWGIHGASFGANRVTCVDISERAIALARENAALNGLAHLMEFETRDVFERLRSLKGEGRSFDVIVLDPPAFVKSRKVLKEAMKGYLTINRRAMELLRQDGYLVTCSCSYHMEREMFRDLLAKAARQANREMRLVEVRSQSPDHPVLLSMPETEYLKCVVLQAV